MAKKATEDRQQKTVTTSHVMKGLVLKSVLNNTVTVLVERKEVHPLYKKAILRSKKYLVENSLGAKEGDLIEMVQIRPISKNKHFGVSKIIGRDIEVMVNEQLKEDVAEAIAEVMPEENESEQLAVSSEQVEEKTEEVKSQNAKVKNTIKKLKVEKKEEK